MKYTSEQKRQLVSRYQNGESISDISTETGIARSTLYSWLKPYHTTTTEAGTIITPKEFTSLKKRVEKLENMIQVLKSVDCTVSSPLQDKLKALEALYGQFSVHTLCDALEVPRGTFYNHILRNKKENKSYQFRRTELSERIKQIFDESHQIYGARKIKSVLEARGIITSEKMVSELMQEMGLYSIRNNAKHIYQQFNKKNPDKLQLAFTAPAPNKVWVSDVTYFKFNDKFFYICAVLDLYSRRVISYKVSQKNSSQLITSTFRLAYEARRPAAGLLFHSDRGAQYTAFAFQKLLKKLQIEQSFSPAGKPNHNAVMESFFSSLKREELYRSNYRSVEEFKKGVEKYMYFYNNERPHSTLGYKTPIAHETLYFEKQSAKRK